VTWHASLALDYRPDGARTVLARRHSGPLLVQKALYPEGAGICHSILVHPPGGIAGGDALALDVRAQTGAHAVITTPGATRWYKAAGRQASQHVQLRIDGRLEWLPQETLVFDAADVASRIDVALGATATTVGWDIVALGRAASGEAFASGCFAQSISLSVAGRAVWLERTRLVGGDALLDSPVGLAGHRAFGCLWAYGPAWDDERLAAVRTTGVAVTALAPRLLVARALGVGTAQVRAALTAVWSAVRPLVFGVAATPPRIWAT